MPFHSHSIAPGSFRPGSGAIAPWLLGPTRRAVQSYGQLFAVPPPLCLLLLVLAVGPVFPMVAAAELSPSLTRLTPPLVATLPNTTTALLVKPDMGLDPDVGSRGKGSVPVAMDHPFSPLSNRSGLVPGPVDILLAGWNGIGSRFPLQATTLTAAAQQATPSSSRQLANIASPPKLHPPRLRGTSGSAPHDSERHALAEYPWKWMWQNPWTSLGFASLAVLCCMQPALGGQGNVSGRGPPAWSPEMETRYPFRNWSRDIMVWSILNSDLDARRKCAAVILQLRGGAEELVRALPPQAIIAGGHINGVQVDPMTFLMHSLSERYSQLGEETRLAALTDLMNFHRQGQERIDALITRFDTIRQRANQEGQLAMSMQGLAWILLRACAVNDTQLMTLLQPFGGLFPADAAQYQQLCTLLRRMGHIIERSPGNIASQLRGGSSQTQSFFAGQGQQHDPWHVQPASDPWSSAFASPTSAMYPAFGTAPAHAQIQATGAYAYASFDADSENGTDTDTISSLGDGDLDLPASIPPTATQAEIAQHLFWAYEAAKSRWRRFTGKPVRAVRRFIRRKGKGKGGERGSKGKGKGKVFLAETSDAELEEIFIGRGKGKGGLKGVRSSGKGKGRVGNPIGPDGTQMECNGCGSRDHFIRDCDHSGARKGGNGKGATSFYATGAGKGASAYVSTVQPPPLEDEGPLAGLAIPTQVQTVLMVHEVGGAAPSNQPPAAPAPPQLEQPPMHIPAWNVPVEAGSVPGPSAESMAGSAPGQQTQPALDLGQQFSAYHHFPQVAMAPMPPPVDLPVWATMESFGFAQPEGRVQPAPLAANPLFPGAVGLNGTSSLDRAQSTQIDQHWHTEATLEQWYESGIAPLPNVAAVSRLDGQHHSFIDQFFQVQTHNTIMRDRGLAKGKGRGKGHWGDPAFQSPEEVTFDGDDRVCAICLEELEQGDRCIRLVCRHVFHVHCWNDLLISTAEATERCPSCRGSARIIARFRFIAPPVVAYQPPANTAPTVHPMTPSDSRAQSSDSFQSVLPWQPAPGAQPEGYYHASTRLPGGVLSILVDIGAWTNLSGKNVARSIAEAAIAAGYKPTQWKMPIPLQIMGVGDGTQDCNWETKLPICIEDENGTDASLHHFETPTVEGSGADLPALLGLKSIRAKQGVVETGEGQERLTFPGPGGYEIKWSPGTKHFPLTCAPSGHLVIPLGDFSKIKEQQGGLPQPGTVFHARQERYSTGGSSSSSRQGHRNKSTSAAGQ